MLCFKAACLLFPNSGSDDISEASGIVVSLWNMTTGGARAACFSTARAELFKKVPGEGNRANVIVRGPSLVVTTPLEWWHVSWRTGNISELSH